MPYPIRGEEEHDFHDRAIIVSNLNSHFVRTIQNRFDYSFACQFRQRSGGLLLHAQQVRKLDTFLVNGEVAIVAQIEEVPHGRLQNYPRCLEFEATILSTSHDSAIKLRVWIDVSSIELMHRAIACAISLCS